MITRQELMRIAARKGYPPHVLEKDYALTWVLKAICENPALSKYLVFKGGTCLNKVYIENYRLSEDLDFTASPEGKLSLEELTRELKNAFNAANAQGAPNLILVEKETHANPFHAIFQVKYMGPLGQGRVKLEISLTEKIISETKQLQSIETSYSDVPTFKIRCYALVEILAEKLRAAMQRSKSRDYYDVWQIMTRPDLLPEYKGDEGLKKIRGLVTEKCASKGIDYAPELIFEAGRLSEAEKLWNSDLKQLTKNLPEFKKVINDLTKELPALAKQ